MTHLATSFLSTLDFPPSPSFSQRDFITLPVADLLALTSDDKDATMSEIDFWTESDDGPAGRYDLNSEISDWRFEKFSG